MPTPITIAIDDTVLEAELNDSDSAKALLERLPLSVRMSRWGDEYYGDVGKKLDVRPARDAREDMEGGELAFWIPGNALCVFFGPTPASDGEKPRAASPVNPVGRVSGDVTVLRSLGSSIVLRVESAS